MEVPTSNQESGGGSNNNSTSINIETTRTTTRSKLPSSIQKVGNGKGNGDNTNRAGYNTWLYSKQELESTPSRRDGISYREEIDSRFKGTNFIIQVGIGLQLPQRTLYVATTIFHRFYMRFSLKVLHYYDIGATSLFLATKIEETNRRLRQIIILCAKVAQKNDRLIIDEQSKEYWRWHDTILINEEIVLEAICFDLNIECPYGQLNKLIDQFAVRNNSALCKSAWAFVNDSCRSILSLRFPPRVVAAAALYFSSKLNRLELSASSPDWWHQINISTTHLREACDTMTELYESLAKPNGEQKYKRFNPHSNTNTPASRPSTPSSNNKRYGSIEPQSPQKKPKFESIAPGG